MLLTATVAQMNDWAKEPRAVHFAAKSHVLTGKTVFLSHSSKDGDIVPGAILILENHGGDVYIDDRDPSLIDSKPVSTANHLRSIIKRTRKFVVLASPRSKDSKWIPWELGLGDGIHGEAEVALFPSVETIFETDWTEREYFGLYRRIVYGDHASYAERIWQVIDHRTKESLSLSEWLRA